MPQPRKQIIIETIVKKRNLNSCCLRIDSLEIEESQILKNKITVGHISPVSRVYLLLQGHLYITTFIARSEIILGVHQVNGKRKTGLHIKFYIYLQKSRIMKVVGKWMELENNVK